MTLLRKFINKLVRPPYRAPPNYDALPPHPGLTAPTTAPTMAPGDGHTIYGQVVADHDVFTTYDKIVERDFEIFDIANPMSLRLTPIGVFEVEGAVVTRGYTTVDPARGFLFKNHGYESLVISKDWTRDSKEGPFALSLSDAISIAGTVVVIGGPYDDNYYHGLFNWFARLTVLDLLSPNYSRDRSVRYLIDVKARGEPFASMIAALGIDSSRVIWSRPTLDYRIERAILVSFFAEGVLAPEIVEATVARIKSALGIDSRARGLRRIWIGREHFADARRRVHNFKDIVPILDRHGFEHVILEDLSFADQVRLFSEAAIVAGSHGAGFSNIVFCPPHARMLVIEKELTMFLGIANLFPGLGSIVGVEGSVIAGTSVRDTRTDYSDFINAHFADVLVDPVLLEEMIVSAIEALD